MSNISIIVPVHEINESTEELFKTAIESVKDQKVAADELLVVVPKGSAAHDYVKKFDFADLKVRILENDGDTDFASQLNFGVDNCATEWFTFLEFDDEMANIWIDNVVKYREAYPEVDLFLPLVVDTDEKGAFIGLTNEAAWAQSFSDELGYLDNGALLTYQNFNIDGMAMSVEKFQEIGGMKSNVKLTFIYEFLLRATFQATTVMIIPKFGYKHTNQRAGSLFANYKEEFKHNPMEASWWLETAKKEFYHAEDREIIYEE
ncbi:MAG: glycosyltransferase family 2 protein [Promethearchaeota archaeon]|jgi:GT2 family glycosyltransferase